MGEDVAQLWLVPLELGIHQMTRRRRRRTRGSILRSRANMVWRRRWRRRWWRGRRRRR
jgi:hypothetical protein